MEKGTTRLLAPSCETSPPPKPAIVGQAYMMARRKL